MKSAKASSTRPYEQSARAQAAEDTARRIVEAFVGRLMTGWFDEITLDAIAAEAKVTVQTIIRRFGGKEGLLTAAVKAMGSRINDTRVAPRGDVPAIIDKLFTDYELTGDAVMRLLSLEDRHPQIKSVTNFGRAEHRKWVEDAFADTLKNVNTRHRQHQVDSLVIATDVYTWKLLRRDRQYAVAESIAVVRVMIESIISKKNF